MGLRTPGTAVHGNKTKEPPGKACAKTSSPGGPGTTRAAGRRYRRLFTHLRAPLRKGLFGERRREGEGEDRETEEEQ